MTPHRFTLLFGIVQAIRYARSVDEVFRVGMKVGELRERRRWLSQK